VERERESTILILLDHCAQLPTTKEMEFAIDTYNESKYQIPSTMSFVIEIEYFELQIKVD
jgi:hypothetical protein